MVDAICAALGDSLQNVLSNDLFTTYCHLVRGSVEKSNRRDGAEYKISIATKLFWSIYKDEKARGKKRNHGAGSGKDKQGRQKLQPTVSITSPLGIDRPCITQSKLNEMIFHNLPISKIEGTFSYVALGHEENSLTIHFTSNEYNMKQNLKGLIACSRCGRYVKLNNSGLEWHVKNVHGIKEHSKAYNAVSSARHALVQFRPFHSQTNLKGICQDKIYGAHTDVLLDQQSLNLSRKPFPRNELKALSHPGLEACRNGNLELLKDLVCSGTYNPTKVYDKNGSSGLLWASGGGHLGCVKYLVETCKIDPNFERQKGRRGYAGRTALHWSCRNGHLSIVKYLLTSIVSPMDVDIETNDGTTPFHLAVWQNEIQVCRYMIERGCNVNHINSYGCNSVLWAGQGLNTDRAIFELLLQHKCDFHVFNENGQGILHKAAQRGNSEVCKMLLVGLEGDDILKRHEHGLLFQAYQYLAGTDDASEFHFARDVLLHKHFEPTKNEKSRPYELAKYSDNDELALWLLTTFNKLANFGNTHGKMSAEDV